MRSLGELKQRAAELGDFVGRNPAGLGELGDLLLVLFALFGIGDLFPVYLFVDKPGLVAFQVVRRRRTETALETIAIPAASGWRRRPFPIP